MTIGMALVACCVGRIPAGVDTTMTSTFRRTISAANSVKRSYCPSARRHSTTKSLPS